MTEPTHEPSPAPAIADEEVLGQLADDFAVRRRRGEHPTIDEYIAKYPPLAERIRKVLSAVGMIEQTVPADLTAGERPGSTIGRYKLLERIGEGGFGVVYMAEQQTPVRRKVALKVLKPGMDSRQVLARFEAERQALAIMDHPNIARVLDAGATDAGRPYFVMELVKGVPITEFCDQQKLTPRQRLELFAHVCHAVQHAHQKGIIHRDIKPSNVLVMMHDTTPVVKVIDFGVAKALGQELTDKTLFTGFAQAIGTPLYMSPEQAGQSALDVDTRSDIYSLGVLLYELLTGTTPFDKERFRKAAQDEIRRIIREEDPPKPSTRLSESKDSLPSISAQRHTEPAKLTKLVRGELDWIVMKAMEKDRGRRYETANGLAMDVRRYLNDEAVQACPPSALYRFRKFARRNKGRLLAVALVATGLVAGVVLLAVSNMRLAAEQGRTQAELRRADGNLTVALEALDEVYMKEIENRGYRERQLSGPDRDFLRKGLDFYQKFARQNIGHSGLHKEAARADRRLGFLWRELQQLREAEASFSRAIPMFEMLVAQAPEVADHRLELARCLYGRSLVLPDVGRTPEAQSDCSRAIALWEALAGDPSATRNDRVHLGHAIWHKSRLDADSSRYTSAEHGFTRALHLFEKLSAEFPQERFYRQEVAASHRLLAEVVYRPTSRWDEAERHIRDARTIYAALCAEVPSNVFYRTELVYTLNYLAGLLNQAHQPQQAEEVAREAAKMQEKLLEPYRIAVARTPDDPWAHHSLADVLASRARFAEAEAAFREAIRLEPNDGGRHHNLGDVLRRQGKLVDAAGAYTEAIRLRPGEEASHYSLGHVYACMGQWEKAAGPFAEAAKLAPTNFWTVYRWATLCLYTNDLPNYRRACQAMLEQPSRSDDLAVAEGTAKMFALFPDFDGDAKVTTLAELTMAGTEASPHRKSYETLKALIDYRTGRFAPAVETIVRSAPADELHRDALAFSILAMARHRLGQRVEAGAALAKAQQILATKMPQIKKGETFQDDWHDWLHAQILCREAERTLAK